MPRFIPLSLFADLYKNTSNLINEDALNEFVQDLREKGPGIARKNGYAQEDLEAFIADIQLPTSIVFHGWIEQNPSLKHFLIYSEPDEFTDDRGVQEHQLAGDFRTFITPYLSERLLSVQPTDTIERKNVFSYVCLLETEERAVVEQQLFKGIKAELDALLDSAIAIDKEKELSDAIQNLCSNDTIYCVNALSRAMYASKVYYVESLLKLIKSGACTTRLANWIFKRLELLSLNREHEEKIEDLKRGLRSGQIKVLNEHQRKLPFNFRRIAIILSGTLLIGLVAFLIIYKDQSQNVPQAEKQSSSFKAFTEEERLQLDSLLKDLRAKRLEKDYGIDTTSSGQPVMPGYLALRRGFLNLTMEDLYEDWNKDGLLQQMYNVQNCPDSNVQFNRRKNETSLSAKTGKMKTHFINESDYAVILYVAKNSSGDKVYSGIIPADGAGAVLLDKGDVLFCVAGKSYTPFEAQSGVSEDFLPSFDFTHHFCRTDYNYLESINSSYEIIKDSKAEVRLIIDGNNRDYFQIVDLNNVMSPY